MHELLEAILRALHGPGPILVTQRLFGDNPLWLHFFQWVSKLGDSQVAVVVMMLALWLQGRRLSYGLMTVVLLGGLLDVALWGLLGLPRPNDPRIDVRAVLTVSSFPSGHTVTATLLWGSLAASGYLPWLVALALVAAVMVARLYLGVHYVGDLLGGLAIGLALLAHFYRLLWPRLVRWSSRWSPDLYLALGVLGCLGLIATIPFAPNNRPEIPAFAAGAALGIALENRFVRFTPARVPLARQVFKVVVGLALLALLGLGARRVDAGAETAIVRAALSAAAALWGVLGAPTLFTYLGLSRPAECIQADADDAASDHAHGRRPDPRGTAVPRRVWPRPRRVAPSGQWRHELREPPVDQSLHQDRGPAPRRRGSA
jgi:membrane-associated phospholipid phosphatase